MVRVLVGAAGALAVVCLFSTAAIAENRKLSLYFTHTKESIDVVYKRNGRFVPSGIRELNRFLRDWRRNESTKMDRELFDLLWDVQQEFGGKRIHIVSAYRSPATNSMLRRRSRGVARNSQHMLGRAIDFFIPGAKMGEVRKAGMRRQVGGVGYYPRSGSPFVHFDTGRVRSWPRMSRGQLARLFPDGKTLHLPSNGKALSGYAAAEKAEKAGKLAKLRNRSGRRSLFAFGGAGRQVAAAADPAPTSRRPQAERPKRPEQPKEPERPVRVQTASLAPTTPVDAKSAEVDGGGIFSRLPTGALTGLIGRFRREDEDSPAPEVTPVSLPPEPLTAVAIAPTANGEALETLIEQQAVTPPPIPRAAPREGRIALAALANDAVVSDAVAGDIAAAAASDSAAIDAAAIDAASPSDVTAAPSLPVEVAALPEAPPSGIDVLLDAAPNALGYTNAGRTADEPGTPQGDVASLIPGSATRVLMPGPAAPPAAQTARSAVRSQAPILSARFAPLRGASPLLIADGSAMDAGAFADLTPANRDQAARGGLLLANSFIGAPKTFAAATEWPSTKRFTGLKITVFASPRS